MIKKLLFGIVFILAISIVYATGNCGADVGDDCWVDDPADCPQEYQSVNCGANKVCGYSGGTQCYDTTSFVAPTASQTESSVDGGVFSGGGWLVDCYDYDGSSPFCDNSGAFWCDRNETLQASPIYRKTNCTDFGETQPGTCISGRYNCYGDTNCESTATSDCEGSNGNNNYNEGTCETDPTQSGSGTCVCDSGYVSCTELDTGGDAEDDGCNIQYDSSGSDCSDLGAYSALNTNVDDTCGCECDSGYGHCDGVGSPDDSAPQTNGCEIHFNTYGSDECSTLNVAYTDQNNLVTVGCVCDCRSSYISCSAEGTPGNDYDGCNVNDDVTNCNIFGGWSGTNNNVDSSCDCVCDSGHFQCDDDMQTNGCEFGDGDSCGSGTGTVQAQTCFNSTNANCTASGSNRDCNNDDSDSNEFTCNGADGCEIDVDIDSCNVGSLSGAYNGDCTCDVDPQHHLTNQSAGGSSGHANLWSDQYGSLATSWLFNFTQHNFGAWIIGDHLGNINASGNITLGGGYICDSLLCKLISNIVSIGADQQVTIAGENVTSGTIDEARIDADIARDSELINNCSVDLSCDPVAYDSEINKTYVDTQDSAQDECSEISGCVVGAITDGNTGWDNSYGFYNDPANFTQNLTDGKICIYNQTNDKIQCDYIDQEGSGGVSLFSVVDNVITNQTTAGINVSGNVTADNIHANMSWDRLYSYPVACPGGSAITQLDDTITCSASWLLLSGGMLTGNLDMGGNDIYNVTTLNVTIIQSTTSLNISYNYGNITLDSNHIKLNFQGTFLIVNSSGIYGGS